MAVDGKVFFGVGYPDKNCSILEQAYFFLFSGIYKMEF